MDNAARLLGIFTLALLAACRSLPERHITAAPLTRYGQGFEVTVLAATPLDCRVRTRLPAPYSLGAWIGIRNSAVHAARRAALSCCAEPRVLRVSDWMAGFAAWEVTFECPAAPPRPFHPVTQVSISASVGKRCSARFENRSTPSTVTSNTPPAPRTSSMSPVPAAISRSLARRAVGS